jgi:glycosyltransferase involved in cell wall biosynthesis
MRLLIATDAWFPQINGVVRTLTSVGEELIRRGHAVRFLTPRGRKSLPMPFYPEIRLSLAGTAAIHDEIENFSPHAIHIATEGPLGWAARRACLQRDIPFTTSYHTQFAEYIGARLPIPGIARLTWAILRRFHNRAHAVMVPTQSIAIELEQHGFANLRTWTRGVDHSLFKPWPRDYLNLPRPILLFAGRVAVEKNIEAFLQLDVPGSKVIVGDGPARTALQAKYPDVLFTGYRHGEDYARTLAAADVFVFPSLTDTFGLVMIEAMACGTPVAAFNVASPVDVIVDNLSGALDPDLSKAVQRALKLDRHRVHQAALAFTWGSTAEMFLSWLAPFYHQPAGTERQDAELLIHLR